MRQKNQEYAPDRFQHLTISSLIRNLLFSKFSENPLTTNKQTNKRRWQHYLHQNSIIHWQTMKQYCPVYLLTYLLTYSVVE